MFSVNVEICTVSGRNCRSTALSQSYCENKVKRCSFDSMNEALTWPLIETVLGQKPP